MDNSAVKHTCVTASALVLRRSPVTTIIDKDILIIFISSKLLSTSQHLLPLLGTAAAVAADDDKANFSRCVGITKV